MTEPLTREQRISRARKIDSFLKDEDVLWCLETMQRLHIGELSTGKTSPELFRAQAHLNSVNGLGDRLRALVGDGEHAALELAAAEKRQKEI